MEQTDQPTKPLLKKENLWYVDGQYYDFASYLDRHPGGASFIALGRGRDCSELFHSVHQISSVNFDAIFDKYRVKFSETGGKAYKDHFDWSKESKFHHELRSQVRAYFKSHGLSYKAPTSFWMFVSLYTVFTLYLVYRTITERNLFISFFAGNVVMFWGYAVMHTGSHGGLSKNWFVNWGLFATFCNCLGWLHHVWLQHHVYGHHSFTGLYGFDPDVRNIPPEWCRKHLENPHRPQHRFNVIIESFILLVFPSQFLAQGLDYFVSLGTGTLFGMEIVHYLTSWDVSLSVIQIFLWFLCWIVIPIYSTGIGHLLYSFAFYSGLGICYWAFVEPNHETYEAHENAVTFGENRDWSIHQILNSSNFLCSSALTYMIGGMNYQIEHHLFPSVHPLHYPALSTIVQSLCVKYKVPYVCHKSWFHATLSHYKFLNFMSKP